MTKYLVKILSICAFIVMLPLVILGTALCVTESTDYKVRLFVDGNDSAKASCEVLINGEVRDNNELTLKKNSNVTISIVTTGYDFEAWYKGTNVNYTENQTKVSDKLSYSFEITGNTDLTAKIAVKNYQVTFVGEYDNGDPIEEHSVTYKYGERLESLAAKVDGVAFTGWVIKLKDGVSNTSYQFANFDKSGAYTLQPTWSNQKKVSYFNAEEKQFATIIFSQKDFDNLTNETILDAEALNRNTRPGYKFVAWSAFPKGEPIDISQYQGGNFSVDALDLYLLDQLLEYKLTVALEEGSSTTSIMTYDAVQGFSEFSGVKENYAFEGLKYKDVLYTYNASSNNYMNNGTSLSDAILADYPHEVPTSIALVASWKENERTIIYHNAIGTIIGNATYTKTEFDALMLPDQTNEIVRKNLTNGFKYVGWTASLETNDLINLDDYKGLNFNTNNLDVYLVQTEVSYTLNVQYSVFDNTITTIKYDVTNNYDKAMTDRYYYNLVGLKYNNVLYTYNAETKQYLNGSISLGSEIVAASPHTEAEINCVAVWQAMYEELNLAIHYKTVDNQGVYGIYEDGTKVALRQYNWTAHIADSEDATALEEKVVEKLTKEYTGFCIENGDVVTSVAVSQIKFEVNGVGSTKVDGVENFSFMQILALLEENHNVDLYNGMTIDIVLIFAPVA